MKFWKIRFKNKLYFLCSGNKTEGPIATKRQYENGLMSYAHLNPDGSIFRHHELIGNRNDLSFISKEDVHPKLSVAIPNVAIWGLRIK